MSLAVIRADNTSLRRTLGVITMVTSPRVEEARSAAMMLKSRLDDRGTGIAGLRSFRWFFKDQSQFDSVVDKIHTFWREAGILPPLCEKAVPIEPVSDKNWRRNRAVCPGPNYIWIEDYAYVRKGKKIEVAGYWRLKPSKKR
jgi:hypothetical protein